ncbi:MAG: hypothetical protein N4A43_02495 [Alphaproteobacteria bacterium]|jgi:hypothetical protein|nr:hypothetical protein [Alphaproteobacteria bacterium]
MDKGIIIVALVSFAIAIYQNTQERRKERETRFFEKRREAFKSFIEAFMNLSSSEGNEKEMSKKANDLWEKNAKEILIWGSDDLIKAINKFKSLNVNMHKNFGDILIQMRKDLGICEKSKLDYEDVWKMFLKSNEWKKFDKIIKTKK